ncbi:MAG TPA: hypothetical protein VF194_19285 [Ferrovibrio sp.]|uniref:hypothetical protein n=1 Tax=Ferrovibrio sp. TaxID=1917215 RepID=UPI002ED5F69C
MAIDSIGASGAGALQQFQPRPLTDAGSDNRSIQQFLQNPQQQSQTPPANAPVQPQTANAVAQPNTAQNAAQPRPPARNDENPAPAPDLGAADRERTEQRQTSAVNYSASGLANAAQTPTQAGRRLSLSV